MIRRRAALLAALIVLQGLGGCGFLLKQARAKQNRGLEARGDIAAGSAAAQKVLGDKGFQLTTDQILKGAAGFGKKVTGFKRTSESLGSVGKQVAGSMALGLLGVKKDVTTAVHELYWVEVSQKWDDTFRAGVPGVVILAVTGGSCDKNLRGEYVNCRPLNEYDAQVTAKEIEARMRDFVALTTPAAVATPAAVVSPAAAPAADPYADALALYGAKRYDEAWGTAYRVLQTQPNHWQAWQLIGHCQYAKGDKASALASYRQSLAIHPDNPELQGWVGQLEGR